MKYDYVLISQGYFFGELDLLFYGEIRKYSVVAVKDCDFYVLNKKDFKTVFFQEFRDIGMQVVDNAYSRKIRTKKVYKEAIKHVESMKKDGLSIEAMVRYLNTLCVY